MDVQRQPVTGRTSEQRDLPELRKPPLFWLLQTAGWLAYGIAMYGWGRTYWGEADALVNKTLLIVLGFCLTLGLRQVYRRARGKRRPAVLSALSIIFISFAGAALWRETHTLLFQAYYSLQHDGRLAMQFAPIPLGTLMYDGFVLLAWSLLYYGINDWFEIEKQRERALQAESAAHLARLQALQSQLEPHFLFNTLNAISTLVAEGKNAEAGRMISRLSDFLRLTLESSGTSEIPVAEELEFVRRYVEIEQVRFGDRLRVTIHATPDAMPAMVPALLLQPLIENAVKHGVLPRESGGTVALQVAKQNGLLHISVADDGPGWPAGAAPARGVGLTNTAERLAELYGEHSSFSLDPIPEGGVVATVEIPFRTAPEEKS